MPHTPEWSRAHARLSKDIAKAAKKDGLALHDLTDLVNTQARYPNVVPVLIDWLRNVETKSGITDPVELHRFRSGLYRALTTVDAMGTEAVPLLFDSFYLKPPANPTILSAIGNALGYLAVPSDYSRMKEVAADRVLGAGRASVIEWLLRNDPDDALPLVMGELDDASVRPYVLRSLRVVKHLSESLRPVIECYLDDPDSEVRKQAKRTLDKVGK